MATNLITYSGPQSRSINELSLNCTAVLCTCGDTFATRDREQEFLPQTRSQQIPSSRSLPPARPWSRSCYWQQQQTQPHLHISLWKCGVVTEGAKGGRRGKRRWTWDLIQVRRPQNPELHVIAFMAILQVSLNSIILIVSINISLTTDYTLIQKYEAICFWGLRFRLGGVFPLLEGVIRAENI